MQTRAQKLLLISLLVLVSGYSCKTELAASNQDQPSEPQSKIDGSTHFGVIDEAQAISIAEQFIVQNGYTDLPPMEDRSKLFYESIEGGSTPDEILEYRHNTLERSAYGIKKALRSSTGWKEGVGWTIVFSL